jgi:hypothetical protein
MPPRGACTFGESLMKSTIATLFCCTAAVRADPVDQVLGWLGTQGASSLCRKGSASSGVFSLRSFEGNLCKTTYIAALAEAVCTGPNTENYAGSSCHKYAVAALNGKDPTEVLKEAVKNGTGKAREFACGRPGVPDVIKVACQK